MCIRDRLSEKTLKEIVQVIPTLEDGVEVAMEHEEKSDSSQDVYKRQVW